MLSRLAMVLVAIVMVAGCTADVPDLPPSTSSTSATQATRPTPPDAGLRPVKVPYGDGIAFVFPETAAQAICQAMSATEWAEVVDGEVGRRIDASGSHGTCVVVSGWLRVELSRSVGAIDSIPTEDKRIAGRRVRFHPPRGESVVAEAAIVPIGEQDIPAQQRVNADPVLYVHARMEGLDSHPDLAGLVHRLLAALLPRLVNDGPATPVNDADHRLAYTPTEPVPGVPLFDLPPSVQSMVLCTALLSVSKRRPAPRIRVNSVGECYIDNPSGNVADPGRVFAEVDQFGKPVSAEFVIAGRPAYLSDQGVRIELLRMTSETGTTSCVVLELFRPELDPAAMRTWAEQVATPLLTT